MAEEINSFLYKYCLSSLAATVAETGNIIESKALKTRCRIDLVSGFFRVLKLCLV